MVKLDDETPNAEAIQALRSRVLEKVKEMQENNTGEFHPKDLCRIENDDRWVADFIINNNGDMNYAFKQAMETLEWRQSYGVNEITEQNCRYEYLLSSNSLYLRGHDKDGKLMLMVNSKNHIRGTKDMQDVKKCLIYWIERGFRESKNEQLTLVLDMTDSGMKNVDLEFTKMLINILKLYYPNSLNWILVHNMAWIMNATFQIIKKLLPKRAVDVLKFTNSKNIREYVSEENMPVCWGGKDDYEFVFVPEKRQNGEVVFENGSSNNHANNNSSVQENLNLLHKKDS